LFAFRADHRFPFVPESPKALAASGVSNHAGVTPHFPSAPSTFPVALPMSSSTMNRFGSNQLAGMKLTFQGRPWILLVAMWLTSTSPWRT
jgi:hypothetical protein